MPALDRIVNLRLQEAGSYNMYGEWTPGTVVDHVLWAEIADPEVDNTLGEEGNRDVRRKNFTVRWNRSLIDTPVSRLFVVDEYGFQYNVEQTTEVDDTRKRFITITGIRST